MRYHQEIPPTNLNLHCIHSNHDQPSLHAEIPIIFGTVYTLVHFYESFVTKIKYLLAF